MLYKIKAYVIKLNTHICIAIILLQTKMTISPRWYHPPSNQFRHWHGLLDITVFIIEIYSS